MNTSSDTTAKGRAAALSLQQVQQLNLELLQEFDRICTENGFRYDMAGGTLLGAVRHHGFIPWDDDCDVNMPRADYEAFLQWSGTHDLPRERKVLSFRDESFARNYSRYARTDYEKQEENFLQDDCPWVALDIFAIDKVSGGDFAFHFQVGVLALLRKLQLVSVTAPNTGKNGLRAALKNLYRPLALAIGKFRIARMMDRVSRWYEHKDTGYVAGITGMYGLRERWKQAEFDPQIKLDFAGNSFFAPKNFAVYLKNLYGNYMQLPPENKRKFTCATVYPKK